MTIEHSDAIERIVQLVLRTANTVARRVDRPAGVDRLELAAQAAVMPGSVVGAHCNASAETSN